MNGMAFHFWAILDIPSEPDTSVTFTCAYCNMTITVKREPRNLPGGKRDPTDEELRDRGLLVGCREATVREVMES